MNTTTQPKEKTNGHVTHDATGGKSPKSVAYGDYIQFDDGLYQVRGFGNRKQIWKVQQ